MKAQGYVIIYVWRGERHRDLSVYSTHAGVQHRLAELRRDGYRAWIEEL